MSPRGRSALAVVYLTVFIDLLGFGIILPALPFYAERLGASGLGLGAVLTSYSFAQLLGAAILGRLSDRFGRRPVLLTALAGSAISLTLTGLAPTLVLLAAARAVAGLFGGSLSAAQAYIADVTAPEERARYMGYLGAAIGVGFVLGPALGALLAAWGFQAAAFAAAGLAALNLLWALAKLPESLPLERRLSGAFRSAAGGWSALRRALGRGELRSLLTANFLTMFGFVAMETTLAYLVLTRFGVGERGFGGLLVMVGVVVVAIQGGLIGRLVARFGERRLAVSGALGMAVTLTLLPFAPSFAALAAVLAALAAARALTLPTLATLLSRAAGADEQGGVLGLGQSVSAAARAGGPLVAGWLWDVGPRHPYVMAGALAAIAASAIASARG